MKDIFLMRSTLAFAYGPFACFRQIENEYEAFKCNDQLLCELADSEEMYCPGTIGVVGDFVEIMLSLAWSERVVAALRDVRFAATVRCRSITVCNSQRVPLDVFSWCVDFGHHDVLSRQDSIYSTVAGTNHILHVDHFVLDKHKIPDVDVWGSEYGSGFFVSEGVKERLERAQCTGMQFIPVALR
jgi:hypothetical protein